MPRFEQYLDELVSRTRAILGMDVIGIYLHGSAAMDAFVETRSDIDVLIVTEGTVSPDAKAALVDSLGEPALPCAGVGLELSVVTALSARTPSDAPAFELHLSTAENPVVDGPDRDGDPDLVAHYAMARARGRPLFGPPPTEVIAPVDRGRLLRSFADDLMWAVEHHLAGYAVLNACRALRYARDGGFSSKFEGGAWALDEGIGDRMLIAAALRRQRGSDEAVDDAAAAAFALSAREDVLTAARAASG